MVKEPLVRPQFSGEDIKRVTGSINAPAQSGSALLRLMAERSIVERHLGDGHLSALLSGAHTTVGFHNFNLRIFNLNLKSEQINCGCFFDTISDFKVPRSRPKKHDEISEIDRNTWFVVEGQSDVARTMEGSRPGCCLADFVFSVAFAPALVDVRRALSDAGYLWEPPSAPTVSVEGVAGGVAGVACAHPVDNSVPSDSTYADDSCICCVIRRKIDVASAVADACFIVANVLLRRGMVVNCDRGKSAALLEIRSALSRSAKRELFLEHGTCVPLPSTASVVHLEQSYVHLGSDVCVGGSMGPAVAARVRTHAQAMTPLRRCACVPASRCVYQSQAHVCGLIGHV